MFKRAKLLIGISAALALGTPMLSSASTEDLPDIGTAAGGTLTINQELIYGDAYMRILRSSQPIITDPVLEEYVSDLGFQLVANADDVKTPFHFFLIRDREINAFAFFGGYVAIHSGLFLHAQEESELASVVAHEIAHVTQRHLARSMEDQARSTPLTIAALAGSLLLAIASPEAGIAALTATQAGAMQNRINYTRSNEKEADRFGLSTLAKAGFDTQAMPQFFSRLAEQYRYASTPPAMLLTHPLPEDRITDSRTRADNYPPLRLEPAVDYHLAKARIIARYVDISGDAAHDWFDRRLKSPRNADLKATYHYGKALVYLDNKQLEEAEKLLTELTDIFPTNNFVLDALSDLYLAKKEPQKAEQALVAALKFKPNNPVLNINLANVYNESEQFDKARQLLQRYTHERPNDVNGWSLLSKANLMLGNTDEELAARGELFALNANWNKAIQSYTQASQIAELGSLKQARYDARIDQILIERDRFMALQ
jgi:predicted Zn-dependent protease